MPDVKVTLQGHSYPVIIGKSLDKRLTSLVKKHSSTKRVFLLIDANVFVLYGKNIEKSLSKAKLDLSVLVIPDGEERKSQSELNKIYEFLLCEKISRSDFILAVGGGVLTDLAGYAAATTMRGIRWGAVSTTLLGMVDAAIGGKTGINHQCGKNLIGAFWQPAFVLCDLKYLNTLPEREFMAGLGEVLKYAGLSGAKSIKQLIDYMTRGELLNFKYLEPIIKSGAKYKAKLVTKDVRESNIRMFLNLGHTFAHAIEKTLGYGKLLHGEAVILGLLAAIKLSQKQSRTSLKALKEYEDLIKTFVGFVRYYPLKINELLVNMKFDKKRAGHSQNFVLLKRPGMPFIATGLKEKLINESLQESLDFYKFAGVKRG